MTTQNIPVSQFPVAITLDGTEEVPIVQGGVTKRTTTGSIGNTASGFVPTSREINTEAGLSGGGPLTGDLDLSFTPSTLPDLIAMGVADQFVINQQISSDPKRVTFPNSMKALTGLTTLSFPSLTNDYLIINHAADGLTYKISPSTLGIAVGNVPAGGTTGQILAKESNADYDTLWANPGITLNALSIAANPTGSTNLSESVTIGSTLAFVGTSLQTLALTSDITAAANSFVTTVSAIHGNTVTGTTGTVNVVFSNSPSLVTPALGVATATSLAIGGASIGTDALAVTGTTTISSTVTGGTFVPTLNSIPTDGIYLNAAGQVAFAAGSTRIFFINSAGLLMANASGATLTSTAATATGPTIVPRRSDSGTGVGSAAGASLSLIASSVEQLRVNNGSIYVGGAATGANASAVAPTVSGALSTGTATNPDLVFQTGVKTTTGSTQATATTALTIKGETQQLQAIVGALGTPAYSFTGQSAIGLYAASTGLFVGTTANYSWQFNTGGLLYGLFNGAQRSAINLQAGSGEDLGLIPGTGGSVSFTGVGTVNFTEPANNVLQHGAADAAVAVAQTIRVQSVVAGTSAANGANWTLIGSLPTGTGTSGDIIFQTGVKTGSGTTQGTATTALTIKGETQVLIPAGVVQSGITFSGASSIQYSATSATTSGFGINANGTYFYSGGTSVASIGTGAHGINISATDVFGIVNSGGADTGTVDTAISRASAGIFQIGTSASSPNASGSLNLTNLTASGVLVTGANSGTNGQITLNGSTSGSCTLKVAAAAGTATNFQLPINNGSNTFVLQTDGSGNTSWVASAGGGTVTTVSVASSNGFAGTVATATTTPVITLSTSITGTLQGNGTAISASKVTLTQPATGSTLTIVDGKTLTVNNTLTLAGTDSTTMTFPGTSSTVLTTGNSATTTVGYLFTSFNGGTVSSGTVTPAAASGNYQYYTNNGAHTLAAPAADSAIDILITNGASAGAITFSGFTVGANTGSPLTTTNTNKFIISIRRVNSISTYSIYALQ